MIIDTNALCEWVAGVAGVERILAAQGFVALPVVVLGEYLYGLRASRIRSVVEPRLALLEQSCRVLSITRQTADCYAGIRRELRTAGTPIPANDVWIAALAREHGWPLLSRDSHFDRVAGLARVSW